jgi:hypothetical protein
VPDHVAGRPVDREHLIVAGGDVHRSVDDDRVGLLPLLDPGHELVQVRSEDAAELVDVLRRDLRERRVAVLVHRIPEVQPVRSRLRVAVLRGRTGSEHQDAQQRGRKCEGAHSSPLVGRQKFLGSG